jgi:hypothetical protein
MPTYQFGVVSGPGAGTYGLVQNFNLNKNIDLATAKDEEGEVAAAHPNNKVHDADFEVVVDTETTLPVEGDVIELTINSVVQHFYCLTVKEGEVNSDFKKASVTAKRFPTNNIPAGGGS